VAVGVGGRRGVAVGGSSLISTSIWPVRSVEINTKPARPKRNNRMVLRFFTVNYLYTMFLPNLAVAQPDSCCPVLAQTEMESNHFFQFFKDGQFWPASFFVGQIGPAAILPD